MSLPRHLLLMTLALALAGRADAQEIPTVTIDARAPGVAISPEMFGVFFEDINFGADGGLSAELVKNGSFEFADPITGWRKIERSGAVGGIGFSTTDAPFPRNPRHARLTVEAVGEGFGLRNEGYRGIGLREGARYRFSAMVRVVAARDEQPVPLQVELLGSRDVALGALRLEANSGQWTRLEGELTSAATEPKAALHLMVGAPAVLDVEAVSLMPVDTWKGRRNGLRADLVQVLADMRPGFIRFPGGCIVEGRTLENRYQWKNTVGPVEDRPQAYNRWQVEFADRGRGAYDYYQSFRVGFFEYFLLCADLGAEPVPILNCGMACQFNSGELVPLDELGPYVQDALDLIEFANGPVSSPWGRLRADMGHPEPFGLKYIGIGNEQWGPQYFERYAVFADAIRARHPEIRLITGAGPSPGDARFRHAWQEIPKVQADIVDEHCYAPPAWFLDNSRRYDAQDRAGPRIFMGEYAAHVAGNRNTLEAAVAEAAFITGLERNADIVTMSSYAPLLAHFDAWQWSPNLIWFDNLRVVPTPSYQVQKLFSLHRGDTSLPLTLEHHVPRADNGEPRLYASAARDTAAGEWIVKLVNATDRPQPVAIQLRGAPRIAGGRAITLTGPALDAENTREAPDTVKPVEEPLPPSGAEFIRTVPPHSVTVLRLAGAKG